MTRFVMIKSVLANYYGRVTWGQHINDSYSMTYIDDAAKMDGGPDQRSTFEDDLWRVYDYTFIRNVNQFLKGLRETEVLKDSEKAPLVLFQYVPWFGRYADNRR